MGYKIFALGFAAAVLLVLFIFAVLAWWTTAGPDFSIPVLCLFTLFLVVFVVGLGEAEKVRN